MHFAPRRPAQTRAQLIVVAVVAAVAAAVAVVVVVGVVESVLRRHRLPGVPW